MFLVVIRSDLKNPLFISDVEPISQTNQITHLAVASHILFSTEALCIATQAVSQMTG